VHPLQILVLLGTVRSVAMLSGDIVRALGRPDILSRVGLLAAPLTVVGTIAGARAGLTGVAVGETAATIVTGFFLMRAAMQLLGVEPADLLDRLAPVGRATTVMTLAVLTAVTMLAASGTPPAGRLIAGALTGAGIFWVALGVERGPLLHEARRGFRSAAAARPIVEGAGDAH
jgi:hypothetical protein